MDIRDPQDPDLFAVILGVFAETAVEMLVARGEVPPTILAIDCRKPMEERDIFARVIPYSVARDRLLVSAALRVFRGYAKQRRFTHAAVVAESWMTTMDSVEEVREMIRTAMTPEKSDKRVEVVAVHFMTSTRKAFWRGEIVRGPDGKPTGVTRPVTMRDADDGAVLRSQWFELLD